MNHLLAIDQTQLLHHKHIVQGEKALSELAAAASKGKYRNHYHFMSPGGWINDPNGCIFYKGYHHLFYQHNPYSPAWASMHWGHAVSKDLIHWEHLPIALAPSTDLDQAEDGGCFSGCSVIDEQGRLVLFYTAVGKGSSHNRFTQCMAFSTDGIHFEKYTGNPLIESVPEGIRYDARDPHVFRHQDTWYMTIGGSIEYAPSSLSDGCILLYQSQDLINWKYLGIPIHSQGRFGTMWECPVLFPLEDRWVLTLSPMGFGCHTNIYLIGTMDFENCHFELLGSGDLDLGADYYAAYPYTDPTGRTLLIAWQNGWNWMPGWKSFGPTASEGWQGSMSLPRSLSISPEQKLLIHPAEELTSLYANETRIHLKAETLGSQLSWPSPLCCETEFTIERASLTADALLLELRITESYVTRIILDFASSQLIFDRSRSDSHISGENRSRLLRFNGDFFTLKIFSDTTSIELFTDDGEAPMSNNIYSLGCLPILRITSLNGTADINIVHRELKV